jgi:hypothetical protein
MIAGLGACGERDMLGPEGNPAPVVILRDAEQLSLLFQDVRDRIVASLPEQPPRGELAAAVQYLVSALDAGFLAPAEKAFAAAWQAARRYADRLDDPSAEADLAALWLAMEILTRSLRESGA